MSYLFGFSSVQRYQSLLSYFSGYDFASSIVLAGGTITLSPNIELFGQFSGVALLCSAVVCKDLTNLKISATLLQLLKG
jgi:hypothetical protein